MTEANPAKFKKLVTLLKELFQLDQPDLDFGIYRIMHAKAGEVTQFLEQDLLPQIHDAFAQYQSADSAELKKTLAEKEAQYQGDGIDPSTVPGILKLREQLKGAVDIGGLENEVYDHLYSFFRRYYSEGDFLAKRVYKPGVYAIPYEGEEVTLHWANKDQYYIKTSEYLRDYAFRLRPEAGEGVDAMRVHFKLVDVAEGEHGNVKAAEGKDRVFVLAAEDFIGRNDGELEIRFQYRPATLEDWPDDQRDGKKKPPAQKDLTAFAIARALAPGGDCANWVAELGKPHIKADGEQADYPRLEAHLRRYTARNTFDYFIHKDLDGFLRRELDFYIKNEVMHLDDVESETAARVEQYLSKIKVIRRIAGKIIDFLAQLENFQKKLWLKKKFVVESSYCITLGQIPEAFYPEIIANDAQREEWENLFAIKAMKSDKNKPTYSEPLALDFMKTYPTLTVDTRHFDPIFIMNLLEEIEDLDRKTAGVLFHGENYQALSLMQNRYREQINCIYIDPPYNARSSEISYKNSYKHSSWMSLLEGRLALSTNLLLSDSVNIVAIDENEQERLGLLLRNVFPSSHHALVTVIHNHKGIQSSNFSNISEFCYFTFPSNNRKWIAKKKRTSYSLANLNLRDKGKESLRTDARTCFYPFIVENGSIVGVGEIPAEDFHPIEQTKRIEKDIFEVWPIDVKGVERKWRYSKKSVTDIFPILKAESGSGARLEINIYKEEENYKTVWSDSEFNAGLYGTKILNELMPQAPFDFPKSLPLVVECCRAGLNDVDEGTVLDYFAGSGTTGHAVINLNRENGKSCKFILVEMGDYFDSVLLPRIKKVTFCPEWREGRPARETTSEEAKRSPQIVKVLRLESYEDSLNNLDLRRNKQQQSLLDSTQAQGADKLIEQYLLRYQLNVESRDSQSLLSVASFSDPAAYKLLVKTPGSDESREVNVDLLETFNWLLGLTVQHIAAPRSFSAEFERDSEGRLQLKGRLKQDAAGPWWFRTVTGTTPESRKTLVIWRKLTGDIEQDNLVLETWFKDKQAYSVRDTEFDLIYVNGDNTLENLRLPDETWKVRLIEEDFQRLMFEGTEA